MSDPIPGQYLIRQTSPVYETPSMSTASGSIFAVTNRYIGKDANGNYQQYYSVEISEDPSKLPKSGNMDPSYYNEYYFNQTLEAVSGGLMQLGIGTIGRVLRQNVPDILSDLGRASQSAYEFYKGQSDSGYLPEQFQRQPEVLPTITDLTNARIPLNQFIPISPSEPGFPSELRDPNYDPGFPAPLNDPNNPQRIPDNIHENIENNDGTTTLTAADDNNNDITIVLPEIAVVSEIKANIGSQNADIKYANSNVAYTSFTDSTGANTIGVFEGGQQINAENTGSIVAVAGGAKNEIISANGSEILLNSNTVSNIFGNNNSIVMQDTIEEYAGVYGQNQTVTGDSGNNSVNLGGDGTSATIYGSNGVGGYVGNYPGGSARCTSGLTLSATRWSAGSDQAPIVLRRVAKVPAPERRAVSTTVRTSASPAAAHMAR